LVFLSRGGAGGFSTKTNSISLFFGVKSANKGILKPRKLSRNTPPANIPTVKTWTRTEISNTVGKFRDLESDEDR
jgi:hypothetical protein